MNSIGDLIKDDPLVKKEEKSERAGLLKQLYDLYTHPFEKLLRKKENWKRFVEFCKLNRLNYKLPETKEKFKKNRTFIREFDIKTFCIRLAHIPTSDLYYTFSMCKDLKNTGKSLGAWLFSSIRQRGDNSLDP